MLRYQRQRQDDDGHRNQSASQIRRNVIDHELKIESRRAATRSTLICIFVCGSLLLSVGIVILVVGMLLTPETHDNTPWLVIGPTCIVLGILVLLLSVEIIIKLRKISAAAGDEESHFSMKMGSRKILRDESDTDSEGPKRVAPKILPVGVHPTNQPMSGAVTHK